MCVCGLGALVLLRSWHSLSRARAIGGGAKSPSEALHAPPCSRHSPIIYVHQHQPVPYTSYPVQSRAYASDQSQRDHLLHSASVFMAGHPELSGPSAFQRRPGTPHELSIGVDGPAHLQDIRGPACPLHVHVKGMVAVPGIITPFTRCVPTLVLTVVVPDRVLFEHDASLMASH